MLQAAALNQAELPPDWIDIAAHPLFGAAARRLAANILASADANRMLAALFKDAGHYVAATSAAYLDMRGGLTATMLRQICAGTGLLTANRAGALLAFMAHIGVLQAAPGAGYRTTAAFQTTWRSHLQAALQAAAMLDPAIVPVIAALDDPDLYQRFLRVQATRLYALARAPDPFPGLRAAFLHPIAGCSILHTLALACTDESFAPLAIATVPLAALSRRFGVSQPHVRRLLKRAEASRFLLHLGPSVRTFHPEGFQTIRYHYAAQLAELVACARAIRADLADAPDHCRAVLVPA